ncbi:hypothetical protein [Bifidobacterium mongoliense]|uniref:hypothetical protein n=1 Tax=Bifidobacterium mongoliense TaxID=518643 RepID=UPI002A75AF37|nr:hypothetical protein [Bifidobacterium mongoliense]MDY3126238.1 hypothetical protein [Bifidobacterium mongoliense]
MEFIKTYGTIIVALIGLVGVLYTSQHSRKLDTIKSLTDSLANLDALKNHNDMQEPIKNIQDRLKVETKSIKPWPSWVGITTASIGLVVLGSCRFFTNASLGIGVFVTAILILGFSFWVIPRCK